MRKTQLLVAVLVAGILPVTVLAADTTAPTITSITRSAPTDATTTAASVTFRITFDEPVANVDKADFALAGTGATGSSITSVTEITQSTYNLVAATADGTLYVAVRTSVDNIQDLAGNAYNDAVGSNEQYTVTRPPTVTVTPKTKSDTRAVTDTTIVVEDETAVATSGVSVHSSSTVSASSLACTQTTTKKVTCTVSVSGKGTLVIAATDAAGNTATGSATGYAVTTDVDIDRPDVDFTNVPSGAKLSTKDTLYVPKTSIKFYEDTDSLRGGKVKIYNDKKKLDETSISSSNGEWSKSLSMEEKTYKLKFVFYDKHGTKIKTLGTYKVTVDGTKPTFADMPSKLTKRVGNKVWWSATDNDRVAKYRYTWNSKNVTVSGGSFVIPKSTALGPQTLKIRAYDRAGNVAEKSVTVTVVK